MSSRPLAHRVRRRLRRQFVEPWTRRVAQPWRRWRNAGREYRPIFVSGTMGSGTTLMALSLAQRYRCAGVVTESGHQVASESPLRVRHPHEFASVARYLESLRPSPDWSVASAREDLERLYRGHASGSAGAMIDKGPNISLLRAAFLRRCFPDAWFVLVFRDPVANVEGLRRKWAPFSTEPLAASVAFYEQTHRAFLDQAAGFKERVVGVSYETLVERYDEVLAAISSRLGLEPARSRRRLEFRPNVPGQGVRNVRGSRIGVVTDANRRAYEALERPEIETVRERLGPLYERLGEEFGIFDGDG